MESLRYHVTSAHQAAGELAGLVANAATAADQFNTLIVKAAGAA